MVSFWMLVDPSVWRFVQIEICKLPQMKSTKNSATQCLKYLVEFNQIFLGFSSWSIFLLCGEDMSSIRFHLRLQKLLTTLFGLQKKKKESFRSALCRRTIIELDEMIHLRQPHLLSFREYHTTWWVSIFCYRSQIHLSLHSLFVYSPPQNLVLFMCSRAPLECTRN